MLKGQIGDVIETLAPFEKWTDGVRVYYKFKPTKSGQIPRVYHDGQNGTWNINDIQIEEGRYPTDYDYLDIESELNNPSNYLWQKTVGPKGEKGDPGKDGIAGKDGVGIKSTNITYGLSTSDTVQPTSWLSQVPTLVKGQYLWTRTIWTYTDNKTETGYTKTYIAKDGNNGTDGIAGKDGVGIKTTTITYASNSSGTVPPTTGWGSNVPVVQPGNFLWTKTVWSYTDDTTETGFSVSQIGKTSYIHTAYANKDSSGNFIDFSFSDNQRDYKGTYVDFLESSSNDPNKYVWDISPWKLEREKTSQIDFNNVLEIIKTESQKLAAVATDLNITKNSALITHTDEIMTTITKLVGNADNVDQQVKMLEEVVKQVNTYFEFSDKMKIGKSDSKIRIEIDNQTMEFKDGETVMAWLSGNVFNAQSIVVKQGIAWPTHEAKSENGLLVFRYIGG